MNIYYLIDYFTIVLMFHCNYKLDHLVVIEGCCRTLAHLNSIKQLTSSHWEPGTVLMGKKENEIRNKTQNI